MPASSSSAVESNVSESALQSPGAGAGEQEQEQVGGWVYSVISVPFHERRLAFLFSVVPRRTGGD